MKNNNTIGLIALFRNEAHVLEEFINHYIDQGVDHFYLINNNSDDGYKEIIDKYDDIITLKEEMLVLNQEGKFVSGEIEIQEKSYNNFLSDIKTDWLITCDLDEFIYTKNGYKNIKNLIELRGDGFDQILLKLKMFNSNNNIKQPKSVVGGFTSRISYNHFVHPLPKNISRTKSIKYLTAHMCFLNEGCITVDDTFINSTDIFSKNTKKTNEVVNIRNQYALCNEDGLEKANIICNHYPIQSKEWFFNVKAKRGVCSWAGSETDEVEKYFEIYWNKLENRVRIDDFELKNLKLEI
jgi:hypothetical protein